MCQNNEYSVHEGRLSRKREEKDKFNAYQSFHSRGYSLDEPQQEPDRPSQNIDH